MREAKGRLEYATAEDVFFDFCLWEYRPVVPFEGKLRSASLLFHSFELAGVDERVFDLVATIRKGFGICQTVWGVKRVADDIRWEFYFYDYGRRERKRSITKLLDIVRPYLCCNLEANENLLYFMFSIDIDKNLLSGLRTLEEIHMYIGNPGSTVSSGICYSLTRDQTRMENFYFFFDAKKEMEDILGKIACSAHVDTKTIPIDRILWPEMRGCRIIVVANKQQNDAIYFSRVDVDRLLFFLEKMNYPKELVSFVKENRSDLDHLLYDVGYDYRMEGRDLAILKSGFYGIF
jgi:hypothetical protein